MPELPEVETVMRGMASLTGATIARAVLHRADLRRPFPQGLAARLKDSRIESFRRRGKYILMRLSGGDSLLMHLGMSGRVSLGPRRNTLHAHEHFVIETADGRHLGFVDPRRFGLVDLVATDQEDTHPLLAGMGPEPLDRGFTAASLDQALAGRVTPIKAALLDQRVVAGLGNIYVAEALYRAGIAPRRLARTIPGARAIRLVPAIRAVLTDAIAAGGSSLRDHRRPDGELGYFQHAWRVYDRAGAPCDRCPGPPGCRGIRRIVQSGRSTFYCPRTQR